MRCFVIFGLIWYLDLGSGVICGKTVSKSVSIESVPFVASLVAPRGGALALYCTASVVHDKFLLTAASCLEGHPNATKIVVGTTNPQNGGQLYDVDSFIPHKKYFKQTGDYNVGLIKLKTRLTFGPKVGKVKIGARKVKVGCLVDVAGWGGGAIRNTSMKLRQATIAVVRKSSCQGGLLGRIIRPREMCAGAEGGGANSCVSDEGGPVFKNGTLLGVAASACTDPDREQPALYTRTAAIRGWVTKAIRDNLSYLDYLDEDGSQN